MTRLQYQSIYTADMARQQGAHWSHFKWLHHNKHKKDEESLTNMLQFQWLCILDCVFVNLLQNEFMCCIKKKLFVTNRFSPHYCTTEFNSLVQDKIEVKASIARGRAGQPSVVVGSGVNKRNNQSGSKQNWNPRSSTPTCRHYSIWKSHTGKVKNKSTFFKVSIKMEPIQLHLMTPMSVLHSHWRHPK